MSLVLLVVLGIARARNFSNLPQSVQSQAHNNKLLVVWLTCRSSFTVVFVFPRGLCSPCPARHGCVETSDCDQAHPNSLIRTRPSINHDFTSLSSLLQPNATHRIGPTDAGEARSLPPATPALSSSGSAQWIDHTLAGTFRIHWRAMAMAALPAPA